jgi:ribosomal protein S18 acetylase RimI-like enzyme
MSAGNVSLELLEQERDAEDVFELTEELDYGISKQIIQTIYPSPQAIIGRVKNNSEIVSIAKVSNKIVGFASVLLSPYEKALASISLCGVKEKFQRKKIGKSLIELLLNKCKVIGVNKITCMIPSENTEGLIFLIRCGLKPFVYFFDAYSLRQDGILMFRYLQTNGGRI